VAVGDLTGDGRPEAAVLLSCSPQPSNFYVEEVHAFEDGSKLLGTPPHLQPLPGGLVLDPVGARNSIVGAELRIRRRGNRTRVGRMRPRTWPHA
jgi:hypothetical protein